MKMESAFKTLIWSSLTLNAGLLLGRITGFAREATVAATFGASSDADLVVLMLSVPDLLVNILASGAFGAALIPQFTSHKDQARTLLYQSCIFFGAAFMAVTVFLYWQADILTALLVPGFSDTESTQATMVLRWVIWLIPLTVLCGILTAYLHAQSKFGITSLGTLIVNSSVICGLILVYNGQGWLFLIAAFLLLGGLLRLVSQLLAVRLHWGPVKNLKPRLLHKALLIRYVQATLAGGLLLIFPIIARALASFHGDGSVAALNYATRLVEFPLAITVTFLAAVFFPQLSKSFVSNLQQHRLQIQHGIQIVLAMSLVSTLSLISIAGTYTRLVYGYGNMQEADLVLVNELLSIGLLMLPLQGLSSFLTAVFNSQKNTHLPLLINSTGLAFFITFCLLMPNDAGLHMIVWGMMNSYGLICTLQLACLNTSLFHWKPTLCNKSFITSMAAGLLGVVAFGWLIDKSTWLPSLTFVSTAIVALASLCFMAIMNSDLRSVLRSKMDSR